MKATLDQNFEIKQRISPRKWENKFSPDEFTGTANHEWKPNGESLMKAQRKQTILISIQMKNLDQTNQIDLKIKDRKTTCNHLMQSLTIHCQRKLSCGTQCAA